MQCLQDWWWKARLGKCYYQLGLLRDAEKQFKSALKSVDMISVSLELCKIYLRMDQVCNAVSVSSFWPIMHRYDISKCALTTRPRRPGMVGNKHAWHYALPCSIEVQHWDKHTLLGEWLAWLVAPA